MHETPKEATSLHHPLTVFSPPHILFVCCCFLFQIQFAIKIHNEMNLLQGKLQRWPLTCNSARQVAWGQFQNMRQVTCFSSVSAHIDVTCRKGAQCRAASRNMRYLKLPMIGWKVSVMVWIQSQGVVQESSVLSDQVNHNVLKGYYGFFCPMTPKINCLPQL